MNAAVIIAEMPSTVLPGDITSWGQIGATTAIIGLFIWLVTRGFPAMMDSHRQDMEKVRTWHESEVSSVRGESKEHRQTYERCVDKNNETMLKVIEKINGKPQG